jgi:hypothetical protein
MDSEVVSPSVVWFIPSFNIPVHSELFIRYYNNILVELVARTSRSDRPAQRFLTVSRFA